MRSSLRSGMLIIYCTAFQLVWMEVAAQSEYAFTKHNVQLSKQTYTNQGEATQSLFAVLKELNQSKGVYFLFSDVGLGEIKVKPGWDNMASIEKILDQVLQKTGLKYKKVSRDTSCKRKEWPGH